MTMNPAADLNGYNLNVLQHMKNIGKMAAKTKDLDAKTFSNGLTMDQLETLGFDVNRVLFDFLGDDSSLIKASLNSFIARKV